VVYILADFDPGGFRIVEKVESGLREHLPDDQDLTVERVAVSHAQISEYELVTREVKKSDSGAPAFIAQYGDVSCELEAMPANTLRLLLTERLESHMDTKRLEMLKLAEEHEREDLGRIQDLLES
jgi:hypothetical protein